MANVLPIRAQKDTWRFYRARFLFVGSVALLAAALVALLALAPAYVVLRIEEHALSGNTPLVMLPASAQDRTDRTDITRAQTLLVQLSPVASSTTTSLDALNAAMQARPSGVVLRSLSYTTGKESTIVITGEAPGGAAISAYRTALSADARFKTVSVPISDLAKTQRGTFTITLTGAF